MPRSVLPIDNSQRITYATAILGLRNPEPLIPGYGVSVHLTIGRKYRYQMERTKIGPNRHERRRLRKIFGSHKARLRPPGTYPELLAVYAISKARFRRAYKR